MPVHRRERGAPHEEPSDASHYDDDIGRDHAADLNEVFPCWWVYWSLSCRGLYAFYLGPALVRPLFTHRVQQLRALLRTHESHLHAPPLAHHRSTPIPPLSGAT